MEFLILSVLGLVTFGLKEAFSAPEEEGDKKSDKSKGADNKVKDKKNGKGDKDDEEEKKSPEQELMEAFAKYESNPHKDKRIKINYEIVDKL
jgi:hypothetical protein